MAVLASLDIVLGAQSRDLNRALFKARRDIRKFSRQASQTFGGLARAGGVALGALGAGFALMAKRTLEVTDAQIKMSRSLGVTFARMQELHFAFGQLGIESSKFNKLLLRTGQLYYELERGTSTYKESLGAIGIELKDLQGLNTEQMLRRIADAAKDAGIETARVQGALATAFGARTAGLLGTFIDSTEAAEEWAQRLRDVGGVIRDSTGVEIENLNDTVTLLSTTINAQFTNALINGVGAVGNFDASIKQAGNVIYEATSGFINFGKAVYEARDSIIFLAKAFVTYKIVSLLVGMVATVHALATAFLSMAKALKLARIAAGAFATVATGGAALAAWVALEAAIAGVSNAVGGIGEAAGESAEEISNLREELAKVAEAPGLVDRAATWLAGLLGHDFPSAGPAAPAPSRAVGGGAGEGRAFRVTPGSRVAAEQEGEKAARYVARKFAEVATLKLPPLFSEALAIPSNAETAKAFGFDLVEPLGGTLSFQPAVEKAAEEEANKPGRFKVAAMDAFNNLQGSLKQAMLSGNFSDLGKAFIASVQSVLIDSLFESIGGALFGSASGGLFGGLFGGGANTAHEGAFVPGPPSQESLWLLRGQEWVLTPEQMQGLRGSGGVTINQRIVGNVDDATRRAMRSQAREQVVLIENERQELGLA